jgi:hypothetical protein
VPAIGATPRRPPWHRASQQTHLRAQVVGTEVAQPVGGALLLVQEADDCLGHLFGRHLACGAQAAEGAGLVGAAAASLARPLQGFT